MPGQGRYPVAFQRHNPWLWGNTAQITSRVRGHGFEAAVNGQTTTGVILCQQIKMIDFAARGVRLIEKARPDVLADALAKVRVLVQ